MSKYFSGVPLKNFETVKVTWDFQVLHDKEDAPSFIISNNISLISSTKEIFGIELVFGC
jgi:hypothetical protein